MSHTTSSRLRSSVGIGAGTTAGGEGEASSSTNTNRRTLSPVALALAHVPSSSTPTLPSPSRTRALLSTPPSPSTSMPAPMSTSHPANFNVNLNAKANANSTSTQTSHEKMWHEMQQKLEEVALSGDHVFGSAHSKSLANLRTAQVELAQAWMRSEEEDLDTKHTLFGRQAFAPTGTATGVASSSTVAEQDEDLLLAGERRRANDAHFSRVAMSVVDVTRRLENVARAMAGVELESRGIWAESESEGSSLMG